MCAACDLRCFPGNPSETKYTARPRPPFHASGSSFHYCRPSTGDTQSTKLGTALKGAFQVEEADGVREVGGKTREGQLQSGKGRPRMGTDAPQKKYEGLVGREMEVRQGG